MRKSKRRCDIQTKRLLRKYINILRIVLGKISKK